MPHRPDDSGFPNGFGLGAPTSRSSSLGYQSHGGHGSRFLALVPLRDSVNTATIVHRGRHGFVVRSVDRAGRDLETLVDTAGDYSGVVPLDFSSEPSALRITADGEWIVAITPLRFLTRWDGSGTHAGEGDEVVPVAPAEQPTPVSFACSGQGRFAVWAWGERRELLADRIAPCESTAVIPAGTVVLAVQAEGRWAIRKGYFNR